jgi:uncharacterized oxidoreductase
MKLTNRTILITGGGSGIGLDAARILSEKGNIVLIIGRNGDKLLKAANGLKNVHTYACDITKAEDVEQLVKKVASEFGRLSVLINNAALGNKYSYADSENAFDIASSEFLTNYLSVVRLNEKFLPFLKSQPDAAIVNVTSIVAFSPNAQIPSYSDTKAALHSYTLTLRHVLKGTNVKVFEVMPPLVATELSAAIGGLENGMPSADVAREEIEGIENDVFEIHVGATSGFRELFFANPTEAFAVLNQE